MLTAQHDGAFQAEVAKAIREQLKQAGFKVSGSQTIGEIRASIQFQFNIIVVMLLVMAVLLAVVGGLGLMGTMSINVLERTREIGVMRAIGASNGAILGIVMVEGILIGMVSWLIGALIALPLSRLLAEAVGQVFLKSSPSYVFSITGALLWLGTVIVLAASRACCRPGMPRGSPCATCWPTNQRSYISSVVRFFARRAKKRTTIRKTTKYKGNSDE